jgi:hypothetical protein
MSSTDLMEYFAIDRRPREEPEWAFIAKPPERGSDGLVGDMARGESVAAGFPDDFAVRMDEDTPGFQLPSLLGNTIGLLMVQRAIKDVIESINPGPCEYLPMQVFDHKGRLASADYWVVNPLGTLDAIDPDASDVLRVGSRAKLRELPVLLRSKLDGAPDLFRVPEDVSLQIMSGRLFDALADLEPSNFYLTPLDVTEEE